MHNANQNSDQRVGVNAMNSLVNRAQSQNASSVRSDSFIPHIAENNGNITNHENYFRSNHQNYSRSNHQNYFRQNG